MYDRMKVIGIAKAEIGYLEKKSNRYLGNKTANAGSANYTKYGRDMHKLYPAVMDFPAAWCDAFVDWCFMKAYGVSTAKNLLGGNFDDYTVRSAKMYLDHNALNKTPEVGAQVFYTKNGKWTGCYHTGIVVSATHGGKTITTVEGNTSATGSDVVANGGCVARKTRTVTSNTLFGHPNYQDGYGNRTPVIKIENAQRFDSSAKDGKKFTVKVNSHLSLRAGAGSTKKELSKLYNGAHVTWYGYYSVVSGHKWYLVKAGNMTGYVYAAYLVYGKTPEVKLEYAQKFEVSARNGKRFTVKVNSYLSLRTGAGSTKKELSRLYNGAHVTWYGHYSVVSGHKWYLVKAGNMTGYVYAAYLV